MFSDVDEQRGRRLLLSGGACPKCTPLAHAISSDLLKELPILKIPEPSRAEMEAKDEQYFRCRREGMDWSQAVIEHEEVQRLLQEGNYNPKEVLQLIPKQDVPSRYTLPILP